MKNKFKKAHPKRKLRVPRRPKTELEQDFTNVNIIKFKINF